MYDMSQIQKMDFKELRTAVQVLYDKYIKLKRVVEDTLDNIDESNLATTFRKKLDGYESMLKITAESIESRVSYQDLENNLSQYSTIKQTADQISISVVQSQEYTDKAAEELSSTFTMSADRISTNVANTNKKMYSSFNQTAKAIEMLVGREITESFSKTIMPTANNTTDEQKEMLCEYNGQLYYFNEITKTWREYSGYVESAFKQTADGFELNGCVKVSGDLITSGTITGVDIAGARFWGDYGNHKYFKIVSGLGDIGLFESDADENAVATNKDCMWGIVSPTQTGRTFHMYSYGNRIMGYNDSQKKTYPMGTWDFSSCNVIGLPTSTT